MKKELDYEKKSKEWIGGIRFSTTRFMQNGFRALIQMDSNLLSVEYMKESDKELIRIEREVFNSSGE